MKAAFFRGLQEADTTAQARLYKHVANDLDNKLISPYDRYVEDYAERISTSRKTLQSHLNAFEKGLVDVGKTKTAYHQKCGRADQEEDEARFHAVTESPPLSSTSTRSKPAMSPLAIPEETEEMDEHRRSPRALMTPAEEGDLTPIAGPAMQDEDEPTPPAKPSGLNRKSTVADRLRALTKDSGVSSAVSGDKRLEDSDGLLEIGDVVNASKQWSSFFSTAAKEIPKKSLKIPLWGVYHDLVTGQDLVVYFMECASFHPSCCVASS